MSSRQPKDLREPSGAPKSADTAARDDLNGMLSAVALRDRAAFETLYRRTSPKIFAICIKILRDRSEAEDTLQDVYVTAWNQAATFNPQLSSTLTWLGTIARNRAIDRIRRRHTQPLDETSAEEIVDESPTPAALAQLSQERQRLERCLQALPDAQRHAVREAFFTGSSYAELATRMSVPLGTMKSWIRRSLMQLKACLER
ncbi:sigma-70 family RNA polymerase sigma factor [Paraburkholderia sp. Tr-20389]|uniref:sigma-70 family RNA polymerase sigma factor n=1 Tax=Paraburkholderia sp. Tr-20389 TaxID=2703903 RepID=UPI00197DC30A|nr:sigma-70 family RNA polymerase sigma factor [Paraburkholderia sp. Tr-20389]MBN3752207.1 sigma-70 family RNA polymerase sigma factor [Paraburkholderia sp. Tr-20389]